MTVISRRAWLAATGCALATAAPASARAQSAKPVQVRIGVVASDVSAQPYYAEAAGFFKRVGLEAQIEPLAGGGAIIEAIAGGALDVGFANLSSTAAAHQRGIPIMLLTPATMYTSKSPITVLMKVRGSKLQLGADLNGKTLAVSTLRGELQIGASAWIDGTGGDAKSVHFVELPFSSMAAALRSARIDAAMLTEPQLTIHKSEIELLSNAYDAIAGEFLIGGFVASRAWVDAHPEAARRFASAINETARWANTHRAQTGEILATHAKIDPAVIRSMVRATYAERLAPELIQPVLDAALKYGSLRSPMRAAELLTPL